MTYTKPRFVYDPNLVLYLPFFEMEPGKSANLLPWTGTAPSTGWSSARATLSEVTTPTPPISAKALKVLANDGAGAGSAYAGYTIQSGATKYAGVTMTLGAYLQAASGNALQAMSQIYDGAGGTNSSNLAKDDAWHWISITRKFAAGATTPFVNFQAKNGAVANTTDIIYVDAPLGTFPQMMERSHYGRICHPDGCSRSQASGISGFLFDAVDDLVTIETDPIGVKAVTVVFTARLTGYGSDNAGRIMSNGKFFIFVNSAAPGSIRVTSDGNANTAATANSSFSLNNTFRCAVTRTAAGVVAIYINGKKATQGTTNSGTPVGGNTLLTVGNALAGTSATGGIIRDVAVYLNTIWGETEAATDYSEYKAGNR